MTKCGTPLREELSKAVKAYRSGQPYESHITIDEVVLIVHDDWKLTGHMFKTDGSIEHIYTPRVDVEGGEEDILLTVVDEIEGFVPQRGHNYRLRTRRFQLNRDRFYKRYELLKIIDDTQSI